LLKLEFFIAKVNDIEQKGPLLNEKFHSNLFSSMTVSSQPLLTL